MHTCVFVHAFRLEPTPPDTTNDTCSSPRSHPRVLVGAALGLPSGYALPSFLHYDIGETDPDTGMPEGGRVTPLATPGGGLAYEHVWY